MRNELLTLSLATYHFASISIFCRTPKADRHGQIISRVLIFSSRPLMLIRRSLSPSVRGVCGPNLTGVCALLVAGASSTAALVSLGVGS